MDHAARDATARTAADALERATLPVALVGFDGFIDVIIDVVDRRRDMTPGGYDRIRTIAQFASRASAAAGRSANLELIEKEARFGGNGPLLAGALGRLGVPVTFVGAVGREENPRELHPIYEPFAARCRRVVPVAPPAHTDALEFDDGKIMLGRPGNVQRVTWARLLETVGLDELTRLVDSASLIGIVNWTLAGGVEGIWEGLIEQVLPRIRPAPRRIIIDLSDPAKRTDQDVSRALALLRRLNALVPVTLGLNLAESERIGRVVGAPAAADLLESVPAIRERLGLDCLVVHPREGAAAATEREAAWFDGPFTLSPVLSTGAGDHFNAGFSLAQTIGLPLPQCLAAGCALSGAYVRDAESPTLPRLAAFLRDLPRPQHPRG